MPSTDHEQKDQLGQQLAATLSMYLVVIDLAHLAEEADSAALTELACLVAAMHALLAKNDPALVANAWNFVEGLRQLHRARDGRHASLAGYLRSRGETLAALLAPANLHARPDGSISCDSLGALEAADIH